MFAESFAESVKDTITQEEREWNDLVANIGKGDHIPLFGSIE